MTLLTCIALRLTGWLADCHQQAEGHREARPAGGRAAAAPGRQRVVEAFGLSRLAV